MFGGFCRWDQGFIIVGADLIKRGKIPIKDFMCIVTPLTFYIQSILQKLFYPLNAIIISRFWKGCLTSIVCFCFLFYLKRFLSYFGTENFPLSFIYIFSIFFMLVGACQEPFAFYTTDSLFFATLGILLISFIYRKKRHFDFIGYFLLGMSFCCKQDIGIASLICGVTYIVFRFFLKIFKRSDFSYISIILSFFFLFLAPFLMFSCLFFNGISFHDMFYWFFIIPSKIKRSLPIIFLSLLTFSSCQLDIREKWFLFLSLFLSLFCLYGFIKNRWITIRRMYWIILFFLFLFLIFIFCFIKNINLYYYFFIVVPKLIDHVLLVYQISSVAYFLFVFSTIILFFYLFFLLKKRINLQLLLHFFMPILLFLLVLNFSLLTGTHNVRLYRNIVPLCFAGTLSWLVFFKLSAKDKKINFALLNSFFCSLALIFLLVRINGIFSGTFAEPLKSKIIY